MTREFLDHLDDMMEYAGKVREFLEEMSWEQFQSDVKTQFAIVRALEVVGEAARRIPAAVQNQYSSIPWQSIIGMRNVLAHNYDNADPRIVYDTAREFVPHLIGQLRAVIEEEKKKN